MTSCTHTQTHTWSNLYVVSRVMRGENVFTSSSLDGESHKNSTCSLALSLFLFHSLSPHPLSVFEGNKEALRSWKWAVLLPCNSMKHTECCIRVCSPSLKQSGQYRFCTLLRGKANLHLPTHPSIHPSPLMSISSSWVPQGGEHSRLPWQL